ncbi:MAG TPA: serine/threonine-protein kinase [Ramlibacter sp.]|nr:serine/threonine-protein kinase [Ramlibacter sp.]
MATLPEAMPSIDGYRISRLIGEGRVARIYLADDQRRGHRVALKVLREPRDQNAPVRQRFAAECAFVSRIRDKHVVRVFEHGAGDPGYLAMEYLEGGTLRESMRAGAGAHEAVSLLRQAASGLAAAHRRAIVHRDVKPENFLMRASGELVLIDFGVAAGRGSQESRVAPGRLVGTPRYVSPEQSQGEPPCAAADVYSLGVVFYELLCGRPPFAGATPLELLSQHLVAPVPPLPGGLAQYQPLVDRMLEKRPQRRLADADAVLRAIEHVAPRELGRAS